MRTNEPAAPGRLIRLPAVSKMTGLSRSAIYRFEAAGEFPRRRRLGLRAVAWPEAEVAAWVASRAVVAK